jgi:hypothetical protein
VKSGPDIPITDLRTELTGSVIAEDAPQTTMRGAMQAPRLG